MKHLNIKNKLREIAVFIAFVVLFIIASMLQGCEDIVLEKEEVVYYRITGIKKDGGEEKSKVYSVVEKTFVKYE